MKVRTKSEKESVSSGGLQRGRRRSDLSRVQTWVDHSVVRVFVVVLLRCLEMSHKNSGKNFVVDVVVDNEDYHYTYY